MCGRGIDQVLAHPCSPEIYEHYLRSAEGYVLLAEQANGPIPRRNGSSYVQATSDASTQATPEDMITRTGTTTRTTMSRGRIRCRTVAPAGP
jgi:poly-gamma-glutamate capsule biosynthesis protein CapA/YwtB (metallophosphatase superfamily)